MSIPPAMAIILPFFKKSSLCDRSDHAPAHDNLCNGHCQHLGIYIEKHNKVGCSVMLDQQYGKSTQKCDDYRDYCTLQGAESG